MLAIRQYELGGPDVLRPEQVPDLVPPPGHVRIAVEAAGVHLIDTTIRAGEQRGPMPLPELPTVPGREVAGRVDALGEGVDQRWLGTRAVAHLGPASGGYAEQALAPADRLHEIPDALDAPTAVAAIGTGRTAAGILRLAPVSADDVVIVTAAAGGLGTLLLQECRAVGARSIALAGGPAKLELAREHGADVALDYRDESWPEQVTTAPTVVFDGVGGAAGLAAYELLVPGGRLVRFGWSSGVQNDYDDPSMTTVDVLGPRMLDVPGGIGALEEEALTRAADGTRRPYVGSTFALADAAEAHRAIESRATMGKVVLLTRTMVR